MGQNRSVLFHFITQKEMTVLANYPCLPVIKTTCRKVLCLFFWRGVGGNKVHYGQCEHGE